MFKNIKTERKIGFALLFTLLLAGLYYVFILDRSPKMSTLIEIPALTTDNIPRKLYVQLLQPKNTNKRHPTAPLDKLNQKITEGISITPAMAGTWSWYSEDYLQFEPKQDWPADHIFNIHMSETLFASNALKFDDYDISFTTHPFSLTMDDLKFEQNPHKMKEHNIFATMHFTHPIDSESLANGLKLINTLSHEEIPYTLSYEKDNMTAYVKSESIKIEDKEKYIRLIAGADVMTSLGKAKTKQTVESQVLIPDLYSFLKAKPSNYSIIENDKAEPEQILHISFTDAIDKEEFSRNVSLKLMVQNKKDTNTPFNPIIQENENTYSKDYFIKTEVPVAGRVEITYKAGLSSINGFQLRRQVKDSPFIPSYPRQVKIIGEGSLLAASGEKTISFMSRGVSALKVTAQKLYNNQINHLISQTYGDISSPTFRNYDFNPDNLTQKRFEKIIPLAKSHPKEHNYASLDLSKYMKDQGSGIFFVTLSDWDRQSKRSNYYLQDTRMLIITDMGLVIKKSSDGSRDLFIESIHTGKPISGATISLLGKNGQAIRKVNTRSDGKASFRNLDSFKNEQEPTVFIAKHGKDISFIPYWGFSRQLDYSRFDIGGVRQLDSGKQSLSAFAFSDRGIYRPGETVKLATIIRQGNFHIEPGVVIKAKVLNPRNNTVLEKKVTMNKNGFFELNFSTQGNTPTGKYSYSLYLPQKNTSGYVNEVYLGGVNFSVEEFRPDTMKIKTKITPYLSEGWSSPDGLKAELTLSNLFGTAAQNRKVQARLNISTRQFSFSKYAGFDFKNPMIKDSAYKNDVIEFKETTTDKDGLASFDITMPDFATGTYQIEFLAQGFEADGGRSVSARSARLVSPLTFMVGHKVDGSLNYLKKGQDRSVSFIAIKPDLQKMELNDLILERVFNKPVSVLTKQPNGSYKYESVIKKEQLSQNDFKISTQKTVYKLLTDEAGSYTVNIKSKNGQLLSSVDYNIIERGNMTGALEKNSELTLKLNKQSYLPGERIEMNIIAPYTGTGLITIESNKVHAHKWFKTDTKSSIQSIILPEDLEGNAYVNVTFVRSINSKEIFASPLSYAIENFKIDSNKRQIDIDLKVPKLVKPGEKLTISYSTNKKSKLILFAVDEGILQVASYKLPKPLKHFLQKNALSVETFQILDLVLPEYSRYVELSGIGGGMMESKMRSAMGSNLNPFKRSLDRPAVFWSGIIDSDKQTKELGFTVPDSFSGSLRVMAVAVNKTAMGSASQDSLVRGPFVLSPNVLTVAAPGDEFDVSVGISNGIKGSGKNAKVEVSIELSNNLQVISAKTKDLLISEGDESKASFRLKVLDKLGEGKITFLAKHKDKSLRRSATLSVRPAQTFTTTIKAAYVKSAGISELSVDRELYKELSTQTVSASASPFVLSTGMTDFLAAYPHGCTEQIISQTFPWIGLSTTESFSHLTQPSRKKAQQTILKLQSRQLANGGFGLWPSSSSESKFASIYAAHFLTELRYSGLNVYIPAALYDGAMDYLRGVSRLQTNNVQDSRFRAMSIYLLIRNKEVATNYLVDLHQYLSTQNKQWQKDITSSYMAASYQMLFKHSEAKALINKFDSQTKLSHTDFQSDLTMNAQYVYLLSKHFKDKELDVQTDIMPLLEPVMTGRLNTISASYTVLALSAYSDRNTNKFGKDELEFFSIGATQIALPLSQTKPFSLSNIAQNTKKLGIKSKTPMFYQLLQSGYDKGTHDTAKSSGIEIYRDFTDANGTRLTSFVQGQEVYVKIKVRSLDKSYLPNIVLIDLLPGGFEVIRKSVNRSTGLWTADYTDIREDRIVYYGGFTDSITELSYKVKVTASGEFIVPSASAKSMYDSRIHSHTASFKVTVKSTD